MYRTTVAMVLGLLGSSALAADFPIKAEPAFSAPPAFNWSGFYIGAHGGYGWGHDPFTSTTKLDTFAPGPITFGGIDSKGYVAGGHAGYNWQYGAIVGGLEIDMSSTGIKGTNTVRQNGVFDDFRCDPLPPHTCTTVRVPTSMTLTQQDNFAYLGTARARIGFLAWQHGLLYGTAGLAWTHFVQTTTQASTNTFGTLGATSTFVVTAPSDHFGAVIGGGGEVSLASLGLPNLLARIEYLHYDFGSQGSSAFVSTLFQSSSTTSGRLTADVVRAGATFKFQ
jgi:outer membrane immunogenic protein